ncbi:MAG: hypothetical protein Q8Q08_05495 [Candidatus Omnitrophota bacterium]|nr:hypothetical protein [Candidatus Omnitrophota bacterium]
MCRIIAICTIAVGAAGMFYCLPYLLVGPIAEAGVMGAPFLSGAVLFGAGLASLTYINVSTAEVA